MIKTRLFEKKDVERVYDLGINVPEFSVDKEHKFWLKETLERFAEQGFSFVVEDVSSLVGFLLAVYQPVTRKLTWENMYLSHEYRSQGLAEECFNKSWTLARENGALIAEGISEAYNSPSRKMLERLGFQNAGTYNWMLKFSDF